MNKESIILKQILTITKIVNKQSAYINHLKIEEGDEIELSFVTNDNRLRNKQYKMQAKNLRNGLEKKDISPLQLFDAFSSSFEYTEKFT